MKKRVLAAVMALMMMGAAAGCGGGSVENKSVSSQAASAAEYGYEAVAEEEAAYDFAAGSTSIASESGLESVQSTSQKLIKTVNLELQTQEFDGIQESLTAKVKELGGYVESSSIWGNSYYYQNTRSADYTVRIPSDKLDEFIEEASGLGNVTYKNESVEDVTLQYVDTESRKEALEVTQERLLELLEEAESMEDILTIESKLSEIRYELEDYGSRLRVLDNQIDYSTVYISISEVEVFTPTGEKGFFEEVAERFGSSLYQVGKGARSLAVGILGSLPILAVWAVVIAAIVLIIRRILKKAEKKRQQKLHPVKEEEKM